MSQSQELSSYHFNAINKNGEKVQGTIQGMNEDSVRETLEEEFHYQVSQIRGKNHISIEEQSNFTDQHAEKDGGIIFSAAPRLIHGKKPIAEEKLNRVYEGIQHILSEKGAGLSQKTRDQLLHLCEKVDLVRESQNKKHWRILRREWRVTERIAQREIRDHDEKKWKAHEQQCRPEQIKSYTEFAKVEKNHENSHLIRKIRKRNKIREWSDKIFHWLSMIDHPNVDKEEELLTKQKYESTWSEIQKFSAVLFTFYLITFFLGYYLTRSGLNDNIIARVYSAKLFKQLILILFTVFSLLTIRIEILPKRIKSDGILSLLILVSVCLVIW